MPLSPAQLPILKADILAAGDLSPLVGTPDGRDEIRRRYNLPAAPDYWVWRPTITRSEVYHSTSPAGTVFDWATFKAQSVAEQNAWAQMFMGDTAPIALVQFRAGVFAIFSGNAAQNAQRAHVFATGRRLATRAEKLFSAAPANSGSIVVGPSNGNTTADALGAATNPAVMSIASAITFADVDAALNLP